MACEDLTGPVAMKRRKFIPSSDLRSNAIWLVGGSAGQSGVAFVVSLFLMGLLLPEDFGRYALISANVALVNAILSLRIPDAVVRMSADELRHDLGSLVAIHVGQILLVSAISIGILWGFGLFGVEALILVLAIAVNSWTVLLTRLFERKFEYRSIAIVENGASIAVNILSVVGALLGLGGIVLFLRDLLRGVLQYGILAVIRRLPKLEFARPDRDAFERLRQRLSGMWIDGIAEQLYHRLIILLLGAIATEKEVGLFFQARRLASVPNELIMPVTYRMAYNYFSRKVEGRERKRKLGVLIVMEFVVLAATASIVVFWGKDLILLFFNERWLPLVGILLALLGFLVLQPVFETLKSFAMAENRMGRFIVLGRTFQFLSLFAGYIAYNVFGLEPVLAVAYALSLGYLLAFLGLMAKYFLVSDSAETA